MTRIKELFGNRQQFKLYWRSVTFYVKRGQKGRLSFACMREGGIAFSPGGDPPFSAPRGKGELQRGAFRGGTIESKAGRRALGESVSHDRQWLFKEFITP